MWLLLWRANIYLQTLFGGSQVFGNVKAYILVLANDIGPIFLGSAEINLELLDTWCWQRQRQRPPVGSWDLLKGNYCWHPHPSLLLPPPSHRSLLTPPPCSWQFLAGEINKSLQSQQFSSFGNIDLSQNILPKRCHVSTGHNVDTVAWAEWKYQKVALLDLDLDHVPVE